MKDPNSVGIISIEAYLPAKSIPPKKCEKFVNYLELHTLLPKQYIEDIRKENKLPGFVESNYDGWEKQPWYDAWVDSLPEKKRKDPFQGTKERLRVPLDPVSIKTSLIPHPMIPSDAETIAGALAIFAGNVDKDSIDLVMAHSQVPDRALPQNVSLIQHKLKLKNAGAYSVDTCCSSFVSMIEIATSLVKSGIKKKILIVSSYIDSHVTDKTTHFSVDTGDAAVAAIITATEKDTGYVSSHSSSHGDRHDGIIYERRSPLLFKSLDGGPDYSQLFTTFSNMESCKEIAKNAERDMVEVVTNALKKGESDIGNVDFFVTHQPVVWAGEAWRKAIGIAETKFYESFEKYGNIATCAAAVNFLEAIEKGLIKTDDRVLIASSGAGENHIAIYTKICKTLVENVQAFMKDEE